MLVGAPPAADDAPALVLSEGEWQRRFGGDRAIVGAHLTINGRPHVVAAVLPADFVFPLAGSGIDFWVVQPLRADWRTSRDAFVLELVARPRDGTGAAAAAAAIESAGARLLERMPGPERAWRAEPLVERSLSWLREPLAMTWLAAVALLAVACLNLGYALAARYVGRHHETALRLAIGASRLQAGRGLFLESWMLTTAGTVGGLLVATGTVRVWVGAAPDLVPRLRGLDLSPALVGFTALLSVVAPVALSAVPSGAPRDCRSLGDCVATARMRCGAVPLRSCWPLRPRWPRSS